MSRTGFAVIAWIPQKCVNLIFLIGMTCVCIGGVFAQGSPQSQIPAFDEPSFQDKLYEAGGPIIRDPRSGKMILSVTIEGERSVSEHKILSHMQSRVDRVYDSEQLNRDLRELHRTELFYKIEPSVKDSPEGVHLKLVVHEKPIVTSITFHSNTRLDDRSLKKFIGVEIGDPISRPMVEQARQRLVEYYRDKGFANADVQIHKGIQAGETDIVFYISEGELERINHILFVGNEAFSTELLKTKISSRDKLYGVRKNMFNIADRDKIADDEEKLERYYRRLGYFDAKVDHYIQYLPDGKYMDVKFAIDEGVQYKVHEISVSGNKYHTSEELMRNMELKTGEPFIQDKMDKDARLLREIYGAQGFLFVDVTPTPIYLESHRISLVYQIKEGDVYRASDVQITLAGDSSFTKHRVLLNMMGTKLRPGSIIDSREVENAERRLRFSQIFETNPAQGEPPRIEILPVDQPEDDLR